MSTVARGAVGDFRVSGLGLESVIGIDEIGFFLSLGTIFLVEHHGVVASGAGLFRQLSSGDRRVLIIGRENTVLSVAVRADRCVGLTLFEELPVNTVPIVPLDRFVTLATGGRNVGPGNRGILKRGRQNLVSRTLGSMAVDTIGGRMTPALANLTMNTRLID